MQTITLIPVGGLLPEIINEADFYTALNKASSINGVEQFISVKEKRYNLTTLSISSTSSGMAGYLFTQVFIPSTNGQVLFTLLQAPSPSVQTLVSVGGQVQEYGVDYTISGTTLTWLNSDFQLSITDRIIIYFS